MSLVLLYSSITRSIIFVVTMHLLVLAARVSGDNCPGRDSETPSIGATPALARTSPYTDTGDTEIRDGKLLTSIDKYSCSMGKINDNYL